MVGGSNCKWREKRGRGGIGSGGGGGGSVLRGMRMIRMAGKGGGEIVGRV